MEHLLHTPSDSCRARGPLQVKEVIQYSKSIRTYPEFQHGALVAHHVLKHYCEDALEEDAFPIYTCAGGVNLEERTVTTPTSTTHQASQQKGRCWSSSVEHPFASWAATPSRTAQCGTPMSTKHTRAPAPTPTYTLQKSEKMSMLAKTGQLDMEHVRTPQSSRHSYQHFAPSKLHQTADMTHTSDLDDGDEEEDLHVNRGSVLYDETMQQQRELTLAQQNTHSSECADSQWILSHHNHIQTQSQSLPIPATSPHPTMFENTTLYDITMQSEHSTILQDIATLPVFTNANSGDTSTTTCSLHLSRQK